MRCSNKRKESIKKELFDLIKTRRSARSFKDTPILDSILNEMLEAVRLAPSSGNSQGYYFGVIKDKEIKEKLSKKILYLRVILWIKIHI